MSATVRPASSSSKETSSSGPGAASERSPVWASRVSSSIGSWTGSRGSDAVMPGEVGGANLSQDAPGDHPRPHPASVLVSRTLDRRSVGCCALMANTTADGRPARLGRSGAWAPRRYIRHCSTGLSCRSCARSASQSHGDPTVVPPPYPKVRVQYPSYPSYLTITLIEIYLYIYGGPLHEIYIRDP